MTPTVFLETYQHLQLQIVYDWLLDLKFAVVSLSNTIESPFFNYAQVNEVLSMDEIIQIEKCFGTYKKNPAIYFENKAGLNKLKEILENSGYKKHWEDVWMFHSGTGLEKYNFGNIRKVGNADDLEQFLGTFNNCYHKDDPQNPYGELGDYLISAKESWLKHHASNRIEYFMALKDKKPVAVASLTNFAGIGYISNVGSIREVRGEGYGKAVSLLCVNKSVENGNNSHALATEEGHYPYEFYKRIGFEPKFSAAGYVKCKEGGE